MRENIFSVFKKELGYINATNQYLELAVRTIERDYKNTIENDLYSFAKAVNLNVSALSEDYMCRISKSYIISIYSCLENYLKNFKGLPGSPTNIIGKSKKEEVSWLEWTLDISVPHIKKEIENDVAICEYYRLLRNSIIHYGETTSSIKTKRSSIKTDTNQRLQAPNDLNSLTFDDQVLFSRAAYNVAKFIFINSQYDLGSILKSYKEDMAKLVKPFAEPSSHNRAAKKVKHFIYGLYPEFLQDNWEDAIFALLD